MRTILIICLALVSTIAMAQQPSKGAILVGGDISASIEKDTYKDDASGNTFETNTAAFGLNPRGGLVLFDGFMVGAIINLGTYRSKFGGSKDTGTRFQAGPFVRYYMPFGAFAEVNVVGGVQTSKFTDQFGVSSGTQTDGLVSGFLGAGYAYFLNSSVSLEPLIGFGFDRAKLDNNDVTTQRGLRVRISLVVYIRNEN